jgi:signal transduction histidine kinase
MIMIRSLTSIVKYDKLKLENHFYEMLTATVSHDMRTPLNAIIGLLHNLKGSITDERGLKFLDIILNSSKILLFLVNDLLDFFQIRHGKFKMNITKVNIKHTVHKLLDIFRVAA